MADYIEALAHLRWNGREWRSMMSDFVDEAGVQGIYASGQEREFRRFW
ncbi:MAG: hypothetical protein H6765_06005 [Candidatus Peribacteria bacterium]|nr:MAG: hypothetical protein H6765_06005 [Candidatus Peribacteria bacterium]